MHWMENADMVNGKNKILIWLDCHFGLPLGLPFWV